MKCPICTKINPSDTALCTCGYDFISGARKSNRSAKGTNTGRNVFFALLSLGFLSVTLLLLWPKSSNYSASSITPQSADLESAAPGIASESKSPPIPVKATPKPSAWNYDTGTDTLSGKSYSTAILKSVNMVDFSFPYQGPQHATLTLRKHPRYGSNVILEIERGQFLTRIDGTAVAVRFDDKPMMKFWGRGAADNSTTVLFIGNYEKFVGYLRRANKIWIGATVYQEGTPIFEFDVNGLEKF